MFRIKRSITFLVLIFCITFGCNNREESPVCDPGYFPCNGRCVNTETDPQNCGYCGVVCRANNVAEAECKDYKCQIIKCNDGYTDKNGKFSDGCECTESSGQETCSTPLNPCDGIDCGAHGSCMVTDGEPSCNCDEGYHEENLTCVKNGGGNNGTNQPPQILSLQANSTTISDFDTLTITAVVNDPDGPGDILGGILTEDYQNTTYNYGAFSWQAQGTYSISLDWYAVKQVRDFAEGSGDTRTFTVIFYDSANNEVSDTITIEFVCGDVDSHTRYYCGGECVYIFNDPYNCGECHRDCSQLDDIYNQSQLYVYPFNPDCYG
ncbi:MAG: hypothetical protein D6828_00040, partial [Nitrospirae bacterium]